MYQNVSIVPYASGSFVRLPKRCRITRKVKRKIDRRWIRAK